MSDSNPDQARYYAALAAVQTGVALQIALKGERAAGATPKHLRVGVNSAMVQTTALVALLIEKGVCTLAEYDAHLAKAAENEKARYEELLGVPLE